MHHRDCRNFAPVDVTRGICHRTKELVGADDDACPEFQLLPKCAHCAAYVSRDAAMGECSAPAAGPAFFAYPDMAAVTCVHYRAR
jgi:4-hydroxyphenylacetate decarboxylase small subunit